MTNDNINEETQNKPTECQEELLVRHEGANKPYIKYLAYVDPHAPDEGIIKVEKPLTDEELRKIVGRGFLGATVTLERLLRVEEIVFEKEK